MEKEIKISEDERDIERLLSEAPQSVDSFCRGHWDLMCKLEDKAKELVKVRNVNEAIPFFADVAFLKQPYRVERSKIIYSLEKQKEDVLNALNALAQIDKLDYNAVEEVAKMPYFGKHGGRAFASAVVRLFCPEKFAIIDWRNLAVLSNSEGFAGLIVPPVIFDGLPPKKILEQKGYISFDKQLYYKYNEIIRKIAKNYDNLTPAKVDLILWTFSIRQKPFLTLDISSSIFDQIINSIPILEIRNKLRGANRKEFIEKIVNDYLANISAIGYLSSSKIKQELSSIFKLIKDECIKFGRNKRLIETKIIRVVNVLNAAIENPTFSTWNRWENWVNPSSPDWKGIDLPTDMFLDGYTILEDFIPIKEYLEQKYSENSFEEKIFIFDKSK